jgi:hypothetical protein
MKTFLIVLGVIQVLAIVLKIFNVLVISWFIILLPLELVIFIVVLLVAIFLITIFFDDVPTEVD